MHQATQYNALFMIIIFYTCLMQGMIVNQKIMYKFNSAYKNNNAHHGFLAATVPQTSHGVLGDFRFDKKYNLRTISAQYIVFDQEAPLSFVKWEDRDERKQLLNKVINEQKTATKLIDFLRQKPENSDDAIKLYGTIFKRAESSWRKNWNFAIDINARLNQKYDKNKNTRIEPATIAQTWNGVLGNFVLIPEQPSSEYWTIHDYLRKYLARILWISEMTVDSVAKFVDIKKAFDMFLNHNHPDVIMHDFMDGIIDKQHAKDALTFTLWVARALKDYLENVDNAAYEVELFELFGVIQKIEEKGQLMRFIDKDDWNGQILKS